MRALRARRKWAVAAVGVAVVVTFAAVALGSPASGVTTTVLVAKADFDRAVHVNSDRVKFQTKDATDVRVSKLEFAPGSSSGWHHHPGIVVVTVASGSVTVWDENCNTEAYGPGLPNGAVFVEGGDEPGQVTTTSGATNYVTNIAPNADPPVFRVEDDPPPCAR
jgi:hypothetical protein